jgi:hypothetical protein
MAHRGDAVGLAAVGIAAVERGEDRTPKSDTRWREFTRIADGKSWRITAYKNPSPSYDGDITGTLSVDYGRSCLRLALHLARR